MLRSLSIILIGVALTAFGLGAGLALGGGSAGEHAGEHAGESPAGHAAAPPLPQPTLDALGVEVGAATLRDFTVTRRVQAVVVDRPLNLRPIVAPIGGIVTALHVRPGQVVDAGTALATVARDPIPRPRLELTGSILQPVNEEVHGAAGTLRAALAQVHVIEAELERIRPFVEDRTLPRKTEIDLGYERAKANQAVESARVELHLHGLSDEEIDRLGQGERPPGSTRLWERALRQNELWTPLAEALLDALPDSQRGLPWSVGAIGELSAAGLLSPELATAVREVPALGLHFLEAASLLLEGTPLETLRVLADAGALEPTVILRAPADAPSWDVDQVDVRVGARVASGEALLALHDARTMWLRLEPIGDEVGDVLEAAMAGTALDARPLLPGTGPTLEGIRVARLGTREDPAERGGPAYALVANEAVPTGGDPPARAWRLRVGLRYMVQVPTKESTRGFVLPADAIAQDGPSEVVFLQSGATFRAQPVHVVYRDEVHAVVADDGALFAGDPVVTHGAFALGLALQTSAGGGPVDPHAGHNH